MSVPAPRRDGETLDGPLTQAELSRLATVLRCLPLAWTCSARRRRLLLLGLATPGFLGVFTTPLHRNVLLLAAGLLLFAAALLFRRRTEGVFQRAEAAALWPPNPHRKEFRHA